MNIDAIAERVRALGYPIGTLKGFLEYASLGEHPGNIPMATGMVAELVEDHEQVVRNLRESIVRSVHRHCLLLLLKIEVSSVV